MKLFGKFRRLAPLHDPGAPVSDPARFNPGHQRAGPETGAPIRVVRGSARWSARMAAAALVVSACVFTGCLARAPLNVQTFAFSPSALPVTNSIATTRVLGIRTLRITPPFDGRSMVYRTGEFSYQRDPYAGFLASPADALAAQLRSLLRGNGGFSDVIDSGSAVKPDTVVEINVTQFYGDIRKPGNPFAVLAMEVKFFDATNGLPGSVILQRSYYRQIPIQSSSPDALMGGWNEALAGMIGDVMSDFWHGESERPNGDAKGLRGE